MNNNDLRSERLLDYAYSRYNKEYYESQIELEKRYGEDKSKYNPYSGYCPDLLAALSDMHLPDEEQHELLYGDTASPNKRNDMEDVLVLEDSIDEFSMVENSSMKELPISKLSEKAEIEKYLAYSPNHQLAKYEITKKLFSNAISSEIVSVPIISDGVTTGHEKYYYTKVYKKDEIKYMALFGYAYQVSCQNTNWEACSPSHPNNGKLERILQMAKAGDCICIADIRDIANTLPTLCRNLTALYKSRVNLIVRDLSITFFHEQNSDDSYKASVAFYNFIRSLNTIANRGEIPISNVNSYSADFIIFYSNYVNHRNNADIEKIAKTEGVSQRTIYRRINYMHAHPFDFLRRCKELGIPITNSPLHASELYQYVPTCKSTILEQASKKELVPSDNRVWYYAKVYNDSDFEKLYTFFHQKCISPRMVNFERSYNKKTINKKLKLILSNFKQYDTLLVPSVFDLSRDIKVIYDVITQLRNKSGCFVSEEFSLKFNYMTNFKYLHEYTNEVFSDYFYEFFTSVYILKQSDKKATSRAPRKCTIKLPRDFSEFYLGYVDSHKRHQRAPITVTEYALEHKVTRKTIYSWIYLVNMGKLKLPNKEKRSRI